MTIWIVWNDLSCYQNLSLKVVTMTRRASKKNEIKTLSEFLTEQKYVYMYFKFL